MASDRRQFLNKINQRISTLTKHGASKQDVLDMVEQNLPEGVYVTKSGHVNIDRDYWESNKSQITETLNTQIKTYRDASISPGYLKSNNTHTAETLNESTGTDANVKRKQNQNSLENLTYWNALRKKYGTQRAKEIVEARGHKRVHKTGTASHDLFETIMDKVSEEDRDKLRDQWDSDSVLEVGSTWVNRPDGNYITFEEADNMLKNW